MIASIDNLLAGMQPPSFFVKAALAGDIAARPQSFWYTQGLGATLGTAAGGSAAGAIYSSSLTVPPGAIYRVDPTGGKSSYLAKFMFAYGLGTTGGVATLCDRLWDNTLLLSNTTSQTVGSPTWPARDATGTTNGVGVMLALENAGTSSSTAAAISVSYTNSSGTSGRTATFLDATAASAASAGQFYRLQLQAGDQGVQSVQSAQFSTAWAAGAIHLVAYRPIAFVFPETLNVCSSLDPLTTGLPQIYNGSTLWPIVHLASAGTGGCFGLIQEVWG